MTDWERHLATHTLEELQAIEWAKYNQWDQARLCWERAGQPMNTDNPLWQAYLAAGRAYNNAEEAVIEKLWPIEEAA